LISQSDIVNINELDLILKIISQCDVRYIKISTIKTITPVLKFLTYKCTMSPVSISQLDLLDSL